MDRSANSLFLIITNPNIDLYLVEIPVIIVIHFSILLCSSPTLFHNNLGVDNDYRLQAEFLPLSQRPYSGPIAAL